MNEKTPGWTGGFRFESYFSAVAEKSRGEQVRIAAVLLGSDFFGLRRSDDGLFDHLDEIDFLG